MFALSCEHAPVVLKGEGQLEKGERSHVLDAVLVLIFATLALAAHAETPALPGSISVEIENAKKSCASGKAEATEAIATKRGT